MKLRVWCIVDQFGEIKSIVTHFPQCENGYYCVPVTLSMGHSWLEGFHAMWANFKADWL